MPDFKTSGRITLQPYDKLGYNFEITVCSSATSNDGFIPYSTSVDTVVAVIYDSNLVDVTTELVVGSPSVSNNIISLVLKYPATSGEGKYKLTLKMTLNDGSTKEADFARIYAENK